MDDVGASASKSHASMGRLGQEMVTLTRRLLGLNPVVAQAANVLGGMAIGAAPMIGVLAGIAAVGFAYNKLTQSIRETRVEQEKLTKALAEQFLPKTGPRSLTNKEFNAALQTRADLTKKIANLEAALAAPPKKGEAGTFIGRVLQTRDLEATRKELAKVQQAIEDAYAGSVSKMDTVTVHARDMEKVAKDALSKLAESVTTTISIYDNLASSAQSSSVINKTLVAEYHDIADQIRNMGDVASPTRDKLLQLRDALAANLEVSREIARGNTAGTVGPLAGKTLPGVSITPNIPGPPGPMGKVGGGPGIPELTDIEKRGVEADERHAQLLKDAILNSAFIIVNALNIGGGGRGSGIGGALGGIVGGSLGASAGMAAGTFLGSFLPGFGTIAGTVVGSLIGGLFDNAKATERNTAALNRVASLLNAPTGFRGAYYTYQAEDARRMYRQQVETARREGTRGGRTGFSLQAGGI